MGGAGTEFVTSVTVISAPPGPRVTTPIAYAVLFFRPAPRKNLLLSLAVALPDLVTGPVFKTGGGR